MSSIDGRLLERNNVTTEDLYQGAFWIKMKAEQLLREGKNADFLYQSEYRIVSALTEMGDPASMILLGEMLQGGRTPEKDMVTAVRMAMDIWQKAGEKGQARGYTNIGLVYLHRSVPGGGNESGDVEYDPEKALEYFMKGYEKGDSKAGRHIGLCYRDGLGTEKNAEMAYHYFSLAADRKDSTARYLMAEALYNGFGTQQDRDAAKEIMKKLVEDKAHDADKAAEFLKNHYE
ncbi:MAG: sel1 repeat family protein [Erysipelotrichaceae bacterium]|nr:sel1 repeat family protein [Erysipelotrichaceae bacterium]